MYASLQLAYIVLDFFFNQKPKKEAKAMYMSRSNTNFACDAVTSHTNHVYESRTVHMRHGLHMRAMTPKYVCPASLICVP